MGRQRCLVYNWGLRGRSRTSNEMLVKERPPADNYTISHSISDTRKNWNASAFSVDVRAI